MPQAHNWNCPLRAECFDCPLGQPNFCRKRLSVDQWFRNQIFTSFRVVSLLATGPVLSGSPLLSPDEASRRTDARTLFSPPWPTIPCTRPNRGLGQSFGPYQLPPVPCAGPHRAGPARRGIGGLVRGVSRCPLRADIYTAECREGQPRGGTAQPPILAHAAQIQSLVSRKNRGRCRDCCPFHAIHLAAVEFGNGGRGAKLGKRQDDLVTDLEGARVQAATSLSIARARAPRTMLSIRRGLSSASMNASRNMDRRTCSARTP